MGGEGGSGWGRREWEGQVGEEDLKRDLKMSDHYSTSSCFLFQHEFGEVQAPLSPPPSCSGDGSATSGASEEVKSPAAMAQAVKVHQDTSRVMYFA